METYKAVNLKWEKNRNTLDILAGKESKKAFSDEGSMIARVIQLHILSE